MASAELPLPEPYDLAATLGSGQAFRWRQEGGGAAGFMGNTPVRLRWQGARLSVASARDDDLERRVVEYLRLGDPLPRIYRSIGKDEHIRASIGRWRGLHLLAQDPWETTVSFIASSASNVPKITRSIEKLCARYGEKVEFAGETWHAFPSAERLARADAAGLRACELGYRARYVRAAARRVAQGEVDLRAIARMNTARAQEALVEACDGIGPKVAACILLFSMGKDDAFPVDRHVQRVISERYFAGGKVSPNACEAWGRRYFGRWAGYAQQYLFHERRIRGRATRPS